MYRLKWCGYAKIDPKIKIKWLSSSFSFYSVAHKSVSHLLVFTISTIPSYLRTTLVLMYTITFSRFWFKWCGCPKIDTKIKIKWMSSSFPQYWFAHKNISSQMLTYQYTEEILRLEIFSQNIKSWPPPLSYIRQNYFNYFIILLFCIFCTYVR